MTKVLCPRGAEGIVGRAGPPGGDVQFALLGKGLPGLPRCYVNDVAGQRGVSLSDIDEEPLDDRFQ